MPRQLRVRDMPRAVIVGLLLLFGPIGLAASPPTLLQKAGLLPVEPRQPAAPFRLPDLRGQLLDLQSLRGKVVFINFWATWCAPCRLEMPEMEQLFQAFRDRPFDMLAVAMQQTGDQVAPVFKELGLHYTALLDVEGEITASYGVRGLPTTLFIDCAGRLVGKVTGPRPWNNQAVHQLLSALLQEPQCG